MGSLILSFFPWQNMIKGEFTICCSYVKFKIQKFEVDLFFNYGSWARGAIAKKYDKRSLFFMFLKFYHIVWGWKFFFDKNYEDTSLDIFEIVVSTNEPTRELVIQEIFIFWRY